MGESDPEMELKKWLNQAPLHRFSTKKKYICEKLTGERIFLLRNESKQVLRYSLVTEECKQIWALVVNC